MLYYHLRFPFPQRQIIEIELRTRIEAGDSLIRLSHWRPGRYEMQNYARFVADVTAVNEKGHPLSLRKVETHAWEVSSPEATELTLSYRFFANQTDAGGTYLDGYQMLFNGITCLMYPDGGLDTPCRMRLDLPDGFGISGGMKREGEEYVFDSVHTLLDSPFLAGKNLQHEPFDVGGFPIHLWVLGNAEPEFERWRADIAQYSHTQLEFWGKCPVQEYHYLYFFLPHPYRHGVEHHQSTVIVMGPGNQINDELHYKSLLEISSHEFFHTWNVKALRPADMWPYRYEAENYSKLHYITEGVTTYYGDLILWKSKIWDLDLWVQSINGELSRHYQTGAQDYTSLAEASFDSWVNGYRNDGFPNRRISFYTKGYIVSMLLDAKIRDLTDHRCSLDTVMTEMYHRVRSEERGYTRADYQGIMEAQTGHSFSGFFDRYIDGTEDLEPALKELGEMYGFMLMNMTPASPNLAYLGFRVKKDEKDRNLVEQVYEGSPAEQHGLMKGANILSVNGKKANDNVQLLLAGLKPGASASIEFEHMGMTRTIELEAGEYRFTTPQFIVKADPTPDQEEARRLWQEVVAPRMHRSSSN